MKNKIYVNWNEFEKLAEQLIEKIKQSGKKFDGVYGVPRGGLPLAVYLSHGLNLPLIQIPENITTNTLIADDISDNGDTLEEYHECFIVCLYSTFWTKVKPDLYIKIKQNPNEWVVFPWEKDEEPTEKDNL